VNDVALRKELRRARGFCNQHAHQWLREAQSALGTALIYRDVLKAALHDLSPSGGPPSSNEPAGLLRGLLGARPRVRRRCVACHALWDAEARYVDALVALDIEAPGICRRHAMAAVRLGGTGRLLARVRGDVEALIAELDEVIRKEDYRFRHEERTEGERSAPARAILWASGADGLTDE
jgi:hypothetical protein